MNFKTPKIDFIETLIYIFMALMLFDNDVVILNGVYWLFATKFVFSSILMFKTFITMVTFITPSHTSGKAQGKRVAVRESSILGIVSTPQGPQSLGVAS